MTGADVALGWGVGPTDRGRAGRTFKTVSAGSAGADTTEERLDNIRACRGEGAEGITAVLEFDAVGRCGVVGDQSCLSGHWMATPDRSRCRPPIACGSSRPLCSVVAQRLDGLRRGSVSRPTIDWRPGCVAGDPFRPQSWEARRYCDRLGAVVDHGQHRRAASDGHRQSPDILTGPVTMSTTTCSSN